MMDSDGQISPGMDVERILPPCDWKKRIYANGVT
jgi:hypothetical protein